MSKRHRLRRATYDYEHLPAAELRLPPRPPAEDYHRRPRELFRHGPDHATTLGRPWLIPADPG